MLWPKLVYAPHFSVLIVARLGLLSYLTSLGINALYKKFKNKYTISNG